MKQYFYKAIIESCEEGGFSAYVPSLTGCVSEGETYEECLSNIQEAAELYLETARERGKTIEEDRAHVTFQNNIIKEPGLLRKSFSVINKYLAEERFSVCLSSLN